VRTAAIRPGLVLLVECFAGVFVKRPLAVALTSLSQNLRCCNHPMFIIR
jgi:hypothetical protein